MIRTIPDIPRGLQVLGLVGSLAALSLSLLFGGGLAPVYGAIALLGVGLDMNAVRVRPSWAIILAGAKLVFGLSPTLVVGGGPADLQPPIVPPIAGSVVLILSSFPSFIGAVLRKMS